MELRLSPEEAELLRRILTNHLTELRGEIVHTERYSLRQELKQDEARLKDLLSRLEPTATPSG
jgi:hypothetical protein